MIAISRLENIELIYSRAQICAVKGVMIMELNEKDKAQDCFEYKSVIEKEKEIKQLKELLKKVRF